MALKTYGQHSANNDRARSTDTVIGLGDLNF